MNESDKNPEYTKKLHKLKKPPGFNKFKEISCITKLTALLKRLPKYFSFQYINHPPTITLNKSKEESCITKLTILCITKLTVLCINKLTALLQKLPKPLFHREISRAPGAIMLSVVYFFCSKKTYNKIFVPIISDLHEEYLEALHEQQHWKARWIRIRYTLAFFNSIGLNISLSTIKKIIDLWKVI